MKINYKIILFLIFSFKNNYSMFLIKNYIEKKIIASFFDKVLEGNIPEIKKYLDKGLDVNVKDKKNKATILHYACMLENVNLVIFLLTKTNIDINAKDKNNRTALHYAVSKANIAIIINLLAQNNLDINAQEDIEGATALHIATNHNYVDIIALLLKYPGINRNLKNKDKNSPLEIAYLLQNKNLISMLKQD